jgi:hypothetical protein
MAIKQIKFRLKGITPLLMHNVRLADPLNKFARAIKAIADKGKGKTDADHEEISRLEFFGGAYTDEEERVIVPGRIAKACLAEGGGFSRLGAPIKRAVSTVDGPFMVMGAADTATKKAPLNINEMWADERERYRLRTAVGVNGGSKTMRTRAHIPEWTVDMTFQYEDTLIKRDGLVQSMDRARYQGLMDYRPEYGRFEMSVIK